MNFRIAVLIVAAWIGLAFQAFAAESNSVVARTTALHASLDRSVIQCRQWVDAKDFKSLAQTADGMKLLAQVLQAKSADESWRQATGAMVAASEEVQAAARDQNLAAATAALEHAADAIAATRKLAAAGGSQPSAKSPPRASNLRQLMMLMDNLRGQAKIALLTGEAADAKRAALVLAELGPLVSNAQGSGKPSSDAWEIMTHDFTQASLAAASSTEEDTTKLKPLFRAMSQACDACHDSR
jgi:hypothetical protein